MERLESLYANKFTNIQKHGQNESSDLCPGIPFRRLVRNIISERTDNPGEEFEYSLTPNEFVKKVATSFEHIDYLLYYRFVLDDIKRASSSGILFAVSCFVGL